MLVKLPNGSKNVPKSRFIPSGNVSRENKSSMVGSGARILAAVLLVCAEAKGKYAVYSISRPS